MRSIQTVSHIKGVFMAVKSIELTDAKVKLMKEKLNNLLKGENHWCVACGAGAKALKELLVSQPEFFRETISEDTINTAFTRLDIKQLKLTDSWCVACGAGASSNPMAEVSNPALQIEQAVDEVVKILNS